MRKALAFLCFLAFSLGGYCQDNIYGDFLMYELEKNVSLDLESARLVDVLKMLSQQTNLNFVSTDVVQDRTLTLYMEDVPLKEAMDILFKANNLAYDYYPESNIFIVKEMGKPSLELRSKVYYLKHLYVKDSRLQTEIDNVMGTATKDEDKGEEEEQEIGIRGAVEAVLSEAGKVVEDPTTNSLVVVDVPAQFPLIDEVVAKLDVPVSKVMIEVEMLDVSKTTVDSMGIKWPEDLASLDVTGARVTKFPFGKELGTTGDVNFQSPLTTPSGNWQLSGALSANNFAPSVLTLIGAELVLNFLRTQSDTKFLARPKILTVSNQTAEIKITTDEAIGVSQRESETGAITADIERTETGTRLRVTPQVNKDVGDITLFVEMQVREAKDSGNFAATTTSFISGTIKDPEERSTKGVVRMRDGHTLFLGGLIKKENSDARTKVPILGDIPFLGRIFRHKGKTDEERELLVFLTPHILTESAPASRQAVSLPKREQKDLGRGDTVRVVLDSFSQ